MRWTLLALLVIGCGSSAKPSTTPLPDRAGPGQVIDVAEAGPLPVGTRFTVTVVKTQDASATVDATYSFHIVGEGKLEITFAAGSETVGGATTTWPMTGKTYVIDERGVSRADGTPLDDDETSALSLFAQAGGLGLPVREALAGNKIDRDTPLALDAKKIVELVLVGAPDDAKGEATLRGVGADGIATLDLQATGTMGQNGQWSIGGTITLEAATLLPRTIEYEVTFSGYGSNTVTSKQTFDYE